MPSILRTPAAHDDLIDVACYIAERSQSRDVALKFLEAIEERLQLLAENPRMGERQRHLADGQFHRLPHGNYVIYYRPLKDGILLVRVLHAARIQAELF